MCKVIRVDATRGGRGRSRSVRSLVRRKLEASGWTEVGF